MAKEQGVTKVPHDAKDFSQGSDYYPEQWTCVVYGENESIDPKMHWGDGLFMVLELQLQAFMRPLLFGNQ